MSNEWTSLTTFSLRNAFDRYPHAWLIAASGYAWLALSALQRSGGPPICSAAGALRPDMGAVESFAAMLVFACLMTLAMMVPLTLDSARHVAIRSFRYRRHRALLVFLAGFVGVWVPLLMGTTLLIEVIDARLPAAIRAALAICFFVGWHCSPAKEKALQACHRTVPLAPHGLAADFACLRFGWQQGRLCGINCWALMLALLLTSPALVPMAVATAFAVYERYRGDPLRRPVLKLRAYVRRMTLRKPRGFSIMPTSRA